MLSKETVWFVYFLWNRQFSIRTATGCTRIHSEYFRNTFRNFIAFQSDSYSTVMWFQETVLFMFIFAAVRVFHFFMVYIIVSFRDYARTVNRINWNVHAYSSDSIQKCICLHENACSVHVKYWVSRCSEWIHSVSDVIHIAVFTGMCNSCEKILDLTANCDNCFTSISV